MHHQSRQRKGRSALETRTNVRKEPEGVETPWGSRTKSWRHDVQKAFRNQ